MEWLDFSNNGMIIMGVIGGLAAVAFFFIMGKSMD